MLEKNNLKLQIFRVFLPLKDPLVTTSNETRAPTYRKYIAEQDMLMSNRSKTFQTFRLLPSVFPLEKQPKILNFQKIFTSNRPSGDHFQGIACINFQKICS